MLVTDGGPVEAFCGYFDVLFKGSEQVGRCMASPTESLQRCDRRADVGCCAWLLVPPDDCHRLWRLCCAEPS
jgi:hypothetical protein